MSLNKKQIVDWSFGVISQIDIASGNLLVEHCGNENVTNTVIQMREIMIAKIKEIERFNLSNNLQKFAYFVQVQKTIYHVHLMINETSEHLLGYLVILNQDLSHLFKNIK